MKESKFNRDNIQKENDYKATTELLKHKIESLKEELSRAFASVSIQRICFFNFIVNSIAPYSFLLSTKYFYNHGPLKIVFFGQCIAFFRCFTIRSAACFLFTFRCSLNSLSCYDVTIQTLEHRDVFAEPPMIDRRSKTY